MTLTGKILLTVLVNLIAVLALEKLLDVNRTG